MKDLNYKKPNKTLLKAGRTPNRLAKMHMIQQQKKLVTQEQTFKKQSEKRLRKLEKYCKKKVVPYKRMLDYLLKILSLFIKISKTNLIELPGIDNY